jgi:hypothetical protein
MRLVNHVRCKRCGHGMKEVATIAPMAGEPGLFAFMCADCGIAQSILIQPAHGRPAATERHLEARASPPTT